MLDITQISFNIFYYKLNLFKNNIVYIDIKYNYNKIMKILKNV